MHEKFVPKSFSNASTLNEQQAYDDPRHLYKAVIVDINVHPSTENTPVTIVKGKSVHQLIENGPSVIMGAQTSDMRWIHLPANNMAWIEELMETLHEEQASQPHTEGKDEREVTKFNNVLRDDIWKYAFHGRSSDGIHCRFMRPLATQYCPSDLENSQSDDGGWTWAHNANVLVLYMPYLHWEPFDSWKERQKRIANLKRLEQENNSCDCLNNAHERKIENLHKDKNEALLHKYLFHELPLHDRRSLDQSYYYNLQNIAHRDEDQIIGQYTWKRRNEITDPKRKMMMVDQLWMWVIDGKTIPEVGTKRLLTKTCSFFSLIRPLKGSYPFYLNPDLLEPYSRDILSAVGSRYSPPSDQYSLEPYSRDIFAAVGSNFPPSDPDLLEP